MTVDERRTFFVARLRGAMESFAAGTLGERELIAVSMAVNDALLELPCDTHAQAVFVPVGTQARAAMLERVAELDRGDA